MRYKQCCEWNKQIFFGLYPTGDILGYIRHKWSQKIVKWICLGQLGKKAVWRAVAPAPLPSYTCLLLICVIMHRLCSCTSSIENNRHSKKNSIFRLVSCSYGIWVRNWCWVQLWCFRVDYLRGQRSGSSPSGPGDDVLIKSQKPSTYVTSNITITSSHRQAFRLCRLHVAWPAHSRWNQWRNGVNYNVHYAICKLSFSSFSCISCLSFVL